MSRLRNAVADVLEETARARRTSSRTSAALGRTLKHFGAAGALRAVASWIRVDVEAEVSERTEEGR